MKKIDTIIFDLGGVLVDWNPENLYKNVFKGDTDKMNWFLTNVCTPEWNIEQDAGRTIEEGENIKIAEYPEYADLIKLFYKDWEYMFAGPIKENVELFKQFKASNNYKVYALTNWSAEKWTKALELFPFFKEFDGVVVSGQEKCRKPFPQIYNIILNRYNITSENAVFIDDNLENIKAAQSLKLNAIHYSKSVNLSSELKKLKISI
ncbi:HAD family hydrolase [Lutibacter citreus]|uniref:HAD family hydrolase n=1 Tax=Lutibacter citreus TaxID=2138210 RepID=UPI000DBE5F9F|nr:HAD family phosphatase [Lutibacter citreus]